MITLMTELVAQSINQQIVHEMYNANLYLYISSFLKNKGLNNLAKLFSIQRAEELSHVDALVSLMTDLGADVEVGNVPSVSADINAPLDIATLFLEKEYETTTNLDAIKRLAIDGANPVVEEAMRTMITYQRKEYEEAVDFMDNTQLCSGGDAWWKLKVWNDSME